MAPKRNSLLTRYLRRLGPGLITGASDDDPAGMATYAVAGASLGYSTLWTAVITLPLMQAVELTWARIGLIIMGDQTNGLMLNVLGWTTVAVMVAAGLAFALRGGA